MDTMIRCQDDLKLTYTYTQNSAPYPVRSRCRYNWHIRHSDLSRMRHTISNFLRCNKWMIISHLSVYQRILLVSSSIHFRSESLAHATQRTHNTATRLLHKTRIIGELIQFKTGTIVQCSSLWCQSVLEQERYLEFDRSNSKATNKDKIQIGQQLRPEFYGISRKI